MKQNAARLAAIGLIVVLPMLMIIGNVRPARATTQFPETGMYLWGPFEEYWQAHGGLSQFGLPLTNVFAGGDTYDAQWFERALFTYTPKNDDPFKVQLQLLGAMTIQNRAQEAPFQPVKEQAQGAHLFPETGHNLSGKFLAYWQATGGLPIYGFPLSEPFMEKNAADGKAYLVQYFERNRFELHPENAGTPFEVQLGLLGAELLQAQGGPSSVVPLGPPRSYPTLVIAAPTEPAATPVPVPPAPALPTTDKPVRFSSDFTSADLSAWKPLADLGPSSVDAPTWSVQNGVLAETGVAPDQAAADEAVLLLPQQGSYEDFTLDVYYYGTSGEALGAVFRYGDGGFYLLRIYGSGPNDTPKASLLSFQPGTGATELANSGAWSGYTRGAWQRLTITAQGSNLTVGIDGQKIIEATSPTFKSGSLGLYARADGSARFDNLRVTVP